MDALQRQSRAGVVVNLLVEVQHVALGSEGFAELGIDLQFEGLEAAVARDGYGAAYGTLNIYRNSVTYNVCGDGKGGVQDVGVAEAFKELPADCAVEFRGFGAQPVQFDYKGLQR